MPADRVRKTLKCPNGHFTWCLENYQPEWCPYFSKGIPCDLPLSEVIGKGKRHG